MRSFPTLTRPLTGDRNWLPAAIIGLFVIVRMLSAPHILMGDEANNMLTIKALIEGDGIRAYFFRHPPFFLLFSALVSLPFGDNYHVVQGISIAFAALAMFPFFRIVETLFDRRTAIVSLLVISVLPMNIIYSTWIKQESMLLFFVLWSLYLYMEGKPYWSGMFLGLALLTKEFALVLLPLVLFRELLQGEAKNAALKRYGLWALTGIAISLLWYHMPLRSSFSTVLAGITGSDPAESSWHYPWYFYLRNLHLDTTDILLPFLAVGLFSLRGKFRLFPLLWLAALYVPLSIFAVKAPWHIYLASPAVAMVIAAGLLRVWDAIGAAWLRAACTALIALAMLYTAASFHSDRQFARLLNSGDFPPFDGQTLLDEGRPFLRGSSPIAVLEYNPALQYFLGISDERTLYLEDHLQRSLPALTRRDLEEAIRRFGIGYLVIDTDSLIYSAASKYTAKNIEDLTFLFGPPRKIGSVLLFRTGQEVFPQGFRH